MRIIWKVFIVLKYCFVRFGLIEQAFCPPIAVEFKHDDIRWTLSVTIFWHISDMNISKTFGQVKDKYLGRAISVRSWERSSLTRVDHPKATQRIDLMWDCDVERNFWFPPRWHRRSVERCSHLRGSSEAKETAGEVELLAAVGPAVGSSLWPRWRPPRPEVKGGSLNPLSLPIPTFHRGKEM